MPKTVVILGKGELACKVLDWFKVNSGYIVLGAAYVNPEPTWSKSFKSHIFSTNTQLLKVKEDGFELGKDFGGDLLVSVFWDKILKPKHLNRFSKNINIHNAFLPKFRGMKPINWALELGKDSHGVTIHEIDEGVDTGKIYAQVKFGINPEKDEVKDVYERCMNFGWNLFMATMPHIWQIKPFEQEFSKATYYSLEDCKDLKERVDWVR
jgi:methionyl-tRNA formyltransferase